jgi:predicted ArsR family transcriptional regulator
MKATLSGTRHDILTLLKRQGPLPADEVAKAVGVSGVAVRQHLDVLESEGLIAVSVERRRLGRPRHLYSVTEAADDFFPSGYDALATMLLEQVIEQDGPRKLMDLLEGRRQRLLAQQRRLLEGHDLETKLATLTRLQNDAGYMADCHERDEGSFMLCQHHCPLRQVARAFPQVCQKELELISGLLDAEVTREQHMVKGDRTCSFLIRPRTSS